MKVVIIKGSPRKNWSTAQLLREAQKGAESVGAEVEYVELFDYKFTGCRSCLACKRKGVADPCKCYWKDELTPILGKVWQADRLIVGVPIYFGEPTASVRAFLERIVFPALSYNDYSSEFKGRVDVDVFLTMNVPRDMYQGLYGKRMEEYFEPFRFLNGATRIFPVCDTLQVNDYTKYNMASFSEEHKKQVRETEYPGSLEQAYQVGAGQA